MAQEALFQLDALRCMRGTRLAIDGVTLELGANEFVAVCGLNGAGKSTLLETMSGLLQNYQGQCRFSGEETKLWNRRALARQVAFLPQTQNSAIPFSGEEVVRMGRYPFGGVWAETDRDREICERAMQLAHCQSLRHRSLDAISGGERQRILLAAVLAQEPVALLLDEPGTYVDLPHQVAMFRTLKTLCAEGLLCVAATHDLNLAATFCSRILLLDAGRLVEAGTPAHVLHSAAFRNVFGEQIRVEETSEGGLRVHYAL